MAEPLPCPYDEADTAKQRIDEVVDLLGTASRTRSGRAAELASWEGANRVAWDEQFAYSQGDLAVAIDDLQALRAGITATIEAIAEENRARRAEGQGVPLDRFTLPTIGLGERRWVGTLTEGHDWYTHPDLASPEVVDGLLQAASGDGSLMDKGGVVGVNAFLKSPDVYLPDHPGLEGLRALVREQEDALASYPPLDRLLQVPPLDNG